MLMRNSILWAANNGALRRYVMQSRLSRPVARRFVAGETAAQALETVAQLNANGAHVTLDYLGENVETAREAAAVRDTYVALLDEIAARNLDCNVSIKLTALGLDVERKTCEDNLRAILQRAQQYGNFVRLDMEGSPYTQITLDIWEQMYGPEAFKNVGIVLQSYLYRTAADVTRANDLHARVRLCKGAYKEPPELAYPEKADVDRNYVEQAQRLMRDGNYPGLATHDNAIIEALKTFARANKIAPHRFEWQMLYGVRRDVQQQLIADGYHVRVYVPFGEAWYPYLMRRMAERPANLLFILKSLRYK